MGGHRLFIIFHGRFPSEKAASLFAAKSAAAFAAQGVQVTMLVPRRLRRVQQDPWSYYGIPKDAFELVYLPTLDITFRVSLFFFSIAAYFYLRRHVQPSDWVYGNDALPLIWASRRFPNTCFELHDYPEKSPLRWQRLFAHVKKILVTNEIKKEKLVKEFPETAFKVFVEQNAVSLDEFASPVSKFDARTRLKLPADQLLAVYTGHLYSWKGVDILAEASKLMPMVSVCIVGGTEKDVATFSKHWADIKNIHIVGYRPHIEMPLWHWAADVLVLPNSAKESLSVLSTSPMKLFEYMASGTPIVASDTPAIAEILSGERGTLIQPDDAHALALGIQSVLGQPNAAKSKAIKARAWVAGHTWEMRSARIVAMLNSA